MEVDFLVGVGLFAAAYIVITRSGTWWGILLFLNGLFIYNFICDICMFAVIWIKYIQFNSIQCKKEHVLDVYYMNDV